MKKDWLEGNFSVLIVEDDIALREQLFWLLKNEGFNVFKSSNVKEAESILKKNANITVVILDLGLPPVQNVPDEGLKFIKLINESPEFHNNIKIIVLTGHGTKDVIKRAVKDGVFDYLIKPVKSEAIIESIKRALLFRSAETDLLENGILKISFSVKENESLKSIRDKAVESVLRQILRKTEFNIYRTAKILSIKRENVYYLLKKLGIKRKMKNE